MIDPFKGVPWSACSEPCGDDGTRTRSADGAPGPQEIRCNTQSCEPSKYMHTHTRAHAHAHTHTLTLTHTHLFGVLKLVFVIGYFQIYIHVVLLTN